MHDIETVEDIEKLVTAFYKTVVADAEIGFLFTDVAKTDFDHHLPIMIAFWNFLLLGHDGFRGNPMAVHQSLHQKFPLSEAHFERWLTIWNANLDALFAGEKTEEAKLRARSIADMTKAKLLQRGIHFGGAM